MTLLDGFTLAIILIVVAVNIYFLLWLAAVPGEVARSRGHHQADAIAVCGWLSLLTFFATWPLALIWAYTKPLAVNELSARAPTTSGAPAKGTP